jgi:hypothetical protein
VSASKTSAPSHVVALNSTFGPLPTDARQRRNPGCVGPLNFGFVWQGGPGRQEGIESRLQGYLEARGQCRRVAKETCPGPGGIQPSCARPPLRKRATLVFIGVLRRCGGDPLRAMGRNKPNHGCTVARKTEPLLPRHIPARE